MPALLPPQALEDDLQVPPDNTFQKITLKRWQWGASNVVSFTWTALSPNPTRRDPKRPPNEDPVSQVLFIRCLLFNFWKSNVTCVLRQWWSLSCRDANCNNGQRKSRNQLHFILKHFWLRPKTIRISCAERLGASEFLKPGPQSFQSCGEWLDYMAHYMAHCLPLLLYTQILMEHDMTWLNENFSW